MNQKNKVRTTEHDLNSAIRVDFARVNRRLSIPQRVEFCLSAKTLGQIEKLRRNNSQLDLSRDNLTNLRHYALLNLPLQQIAKHNYESRRETLLSSSFTFSTRYLSTPEGMPTTLFRSAIHSDGKISQQIQQSLIQNPTLLSEISQAHYWLISEIISQIPLTPKIWLYRLTLCCLAIAILLFFSFIWYFIPLVFWVKLAVCLTVFWGFRLLFVESLIERTKFIVLYHLIEGIFTNTVLRKRYGLYLFSFLMRL